MLELAPGTGVRVMRRAGLWVHQYTVMRLKPDDSEDPADFVMIDPDDDGLSSGLKNGTEVSILGECTSPAG